jgi:hypothetical protein
MGIGHVHGRVYISFDSLNRTRSLVALNEPDAKFVFVTISSNGNQDCQVSLEDIYRFEQTVSRAIIEDLDSSLVVCADSAAGVHMQAMLLIGCNMILSGFDCDEVERAFSTVCPDRYLGEGLDLSLGDFWGAFHHAKAMGWIDFSDFGEREVGEKELDIQEYLHYAR